MNMNVNPVGFGAKLPVSRIKLARDVNNKELPVDNYVREMLANHSAEIEKVADYVGRDRKSTRLNSSHDRQSRMPSSA